MEKKETGGTGRPRGVWVSEEILRIKGIKAGGKLMMGLVAALASGDEGCCFAGDGYLGRRLGVTERHACRLVKQLREKGLLDCEGSGSSRRLRVADGETRSLGEKTRILDRPYGRTLRSDLKVGPYGLHSGTVDSEGSEEDPREVDVDPPAGASPPSTSTTGGASPERVNRDPARTPESSPACLFPDDDPPVPAAGADEGPLAAFPGGVPRRAQDPPRPPKGQAAAAGVRYDPLRPGTSFLVPDEELRELTSLLARRYEKGGVDEAVDEDRFLSWLSNCVVAPFDEVVTREGGQCFKQQKDLAPLVRAVLGDESIGSEEVVDLIEFWAAAPKHWGKLQAVRYLMDVWDDWQR